MLNQTGSYHDVFLISFLILAFDLPLISRLISTIPTELRPKHRNNISSQADLKFGKILVNFLQTFGKLPLKSKFYLKTFSANKSCKQI